MIDVSDEVTLGDVAQGIADLLEQRFSLGVTVAHMRPYLAGFLSAVIATVERDG